VQVSIFLMAVVLYLVAKSFSQFNFFTKVTQKVVHMLEWNPLLMLLSSQFMELVVYSSLNLRYTSGATFNHVVLFFNFSISFVVIMITTVALVAVFQIVNHPKVNFEDPKVLMKYKSIAEEVDMKRALARNVMSINLLKNYTFSMMIVFMQGFPVA
jgi:hypothetical protein